MDLKKRVSNLKNLVEGSAAGKGHAEIWTQALTVMDEMANRIEHISLNQEKILEYVEALDEDLSVMESQLSNPCSPDNEDDGYDIGSTQLSEENLADDHHQNHSHD
jgi:hypothetical protein